MLVVGQSLAAVVVAAGAFAASVGEVEVRRPVDGFVVEHVPAGAGALESDFEFEWGDVAFTERVWERQLEGGGYRVDLTVAVLRGERLSDLGATREFLTEYHERDPAGWRVEPFQHGARPGGIAEDLAFWQVEPGVAVSVRVDPDRFGVEDVRETALGVRPVE
ncbi:hypothetical protein [Marinitenerispora sediminis]|uniref:DUF4390 domain-containing protein n=1 Tax=Marinitenerispora sediminis TaxID=1931232 RepID=A0A368TBJ7_9ACTN|nr:hypothetical protein [Marinitenerispora sediminis]RCV58163.1 hypothetical protein DEF28_00385 [Marinitenerispora sediminis]RCV61454.1 hypothetical protein DEF23_02200 [Marinitenerispora sediminis]RCV62534.1 hypothetical protein DEF24_00735 [Marinitenerispora sediminis]